MLLGQGGPWLWRQEGSEHVLCFWGAGINFVLFLPLYGRTGVSFVLFNMCTPLSPGGGAKISFVPVRAGVNIVP